MKDYRVGAIFPSSKFVARRIAREVNPEYKIIMEYGAGDGAITKEILNILPKDGKLIAIETNKNFVRVLKKIDDNRLKVVAGDVVDLSKNLDQFGQIDMVISGIPFTYLKPKDRTSIIENTYRILQPGGKILSFQHHFLMLSYLKKVAGEKTRWYIEPRNFLPYCIMIAEK
jgi:phospholipid N-methyltransferase